MKKPNLKKVALYCVLHNIKDWQDVPSCSLCQKRRQCYNPTRERRNRVKFYCKFVPNTCDLISDTFTYDKPKNSWRFFEFDICNNFKQSVI